ncbi:hypothetical protein ACHFCA_14485 [Delftia tsuruhatensis]
MPWSATSRRFATIGVMLASALLSVACTRNADDSPAVSSVQAKPASFASSNDQDPYRYLYTVYCNGTVDRLDLVQRSKVGSFQLSERSGSPLPLRRLHSRECAPAVAWPAPWPRTMRRIALPQWSTSLPAAMWIPMPMAASRISC